MDGENPSWPGPLHELGSEHADFWRSGPDYSWWESHYSCKCSVSVSGPKLSLLLQQIRCAWIAFSLWPEDLSIAMYNFSSGGDEGVQCKQSIPVNVSSYCFLKQRWLQIFPSSVLPAQTCPYNPFHGVSTATCGALQEAGSWFFVGVIFNLTLFIRLVCHLASQMMPGAIIWTREQVARH